MIYTLLYKILRYILAKFQDKNRTLINAEKAENWGMRDLTLIGGGINAKGSKNFFIDRVFIKLPEPKEVPFVWKILLDAAVTYVIVSLS